MSRPLISFLAAGVTGMVVALAGAPWWLAATAFGCLALGLGSFVWIIGRTRGRCPRCGVRRGRWWRSSRSGWRCRATASGG